MECSQVVHIHSSKLYPFFHCKAIWLPAPVGIPRYHDSVIPSRPHSADSNCPLSISPKSHLGHIVHWLGYYPSFLLLFLWRFCSVLTLTFPPTSLDRHCTFHCTFQCTFSPNLSPNFSPNFFPYFLVNFLVCSFRYSFRYFSRHFTTNLSTNSSTNLSWSSLYFSLYFSMYLSPYLSPCLSLSKSEFKHVSFWWYIILPCVFFSISPFCMCLLILLSLTGMCLFLVPHSHGLCHFLHNSS